MGRNQLYTCMEDFIQKQCENMRDNFPENDKETEECHMMLSGILNGLIQMEAAVCTM